MPRWVFGVGEPVPLLPVVVDAVEDDEEVDVGVVVGIAAGERAEEHHPAQTPAVEAAEVSAYGPSGFPAVLGRRRLGEQSPGGFDESRPPQPGQAGRPRPAGVVRMGGGLLHVSQRTFARAHRPHIARLVTVVTTGWERIGDEDFDPRPGDIVTVGDDEEAPLRARVVRRNGTRVWVQLRLPGVAGAVA